MLIEERGTERSAAAFLPACPRSAQGGGDTGVDDRLVADDDGDGGHISVVFFCRFLTNLIH